MDSIASQLSTRRTSLRSLHHLLVYWNRDDLNAQQEQGKDAAHRINPWIAFGSRARCRTAVLLQSTAPFLHAKASGRSDGDDPAAAGFRASHRHHSAVVRPEAVLWPGRGNWSGATLGLANKPIRTTSTAWCE